jgi:hypothetical protein
VSTKAFIAIIALLLCSFIEYLDHAVVAAAIPTFIAWVGGADLFSWVLPIYVAVSKLIQLIVVLIGLHVVLNYTRRSSN